MAKGLGYEHGGVGYGRSSSALAKGESCEAGEVAAEEMRGEDRAEDAEKKIEDRARARRIGEEHDVAKDGLQTPNEAHVHQVDREEVNAKAGFVCHGRAKLKRRGAASTLEGEHHANGFTT